MLAEYLNGKLVQYQQARSMADATLADIQATNQSGGKLEIDTEKLRSLDSETKENIVSIKKNLQELENLNFDAIIRRLESCKTLGKGNGSGQAVAELDTMKELVGNIKKELQSQKENLVNKTQKMKDMINTKFKMAVKQSVKKKDEIEEGEE